MAAEGGTTPGALQSAHARLLTDQDIQFSFTPLPNQPKFDPPEWLKALSHWIGDAARFLAPFAQALFWMGVGAAIVAVLYLILREVMGTRWPFRRKRPPARQKPVDWRPEAFKARALLADADRLAAEGRYDEAARLILFRSIDDIEDKRPRLVRPALTARDIAALQALPPAARGAFGQIALIVERSLFAGRALDAGAFAACREAYETFAFRDAWA